MSPIKPTLLVLAAGLGSRYGGLKQIDPVGPNGETIIDYSMYDALQAGFGKLVFVIRTDFAEPFKKIVGARFERRIPVEYVFQELDQLPAGFAVPPGRTKPWGTTHAILAAADAVREPFAAVDADDFYGSHAYRLLAQHLQSGSTDAAMVAFTLRNTLSDFGSVARGICHADDQNILKTVTERTNIVRDGASAKNTDAAGRTTRLTGDEVVSMNFWGFHPNIFGDLRASFGHFLETNGNDLTAECYIPSTVGELIVAGQMRVKVLRSDDSWFGVTYREDRPHVVESIRKLITDGDYPENLWD